MIAYPRHGRDGLPLDKHPRPENGGFLNNPKGFGFAWQIRCETVRIPVNLSMFWFCT